ncbi:MAG: hypothetical protein K0U37_04905 [Gammaproteobacteria bacterium]|nr:hypothetical protein [Gammaproteobacteria bacterium]
MSDTKSPKTKLDIGTKPTTKGFEGLGERLNAMGIDREKAIEMDDDEFETFLREQYDALDTAETREEILKELQRAGRSEDEMTDVLNELLQRNADLINLGNERYNLRQEYKGYLMMLDAKDEIDGITMHGGKFKINPNGRYEQFNRAPKQGISLENMHATKAEAKRQGLSQIEIADGQKSEPTSLLAKLCQWIKTAFCGNPAKPIQPDNAKTPAQNARNLDLARADLAQKKQGPSLQPKDIEQQYDTIKTESNHKQTPQTPTRR